MAKVPVAGRVKTRLARDIGIAGATRFYRSTMLAVLARLGSQPFWRTYVAVSPDAGLASPMLPIGPARIRQGNGELGQRMHRPMRSLPPGPVCVVGTDVPGIEIAHVRRAFHLLGSHQAVFGPAEDGGFWLVGQRRRPRLVWPYAGVAWSRPDTLARTLANFGPTDVGFTERLSDVDEAADLARFAGAHGRRIRRF